MKNKKKIMTRVDLEIEVNLKAWKDPEFKKQLVKNPREALKKLGCPLEMIPENIKVVEESENQQIIVLHEAPERMATLSDAELQTWAARENNRISKGRPRDGDACIPYMD